VCCVCVCVCMICAHACIHTHDIHTQRTISHTIRHLFPTLQHTATHCNILTHDIRRPYPTHYRPPPVPVPVNINLFIAFASVIFLFALVQSRFFESSVLLSLSLSMSRSLSLSFSLPPFFCLPLSKVDFLKGDFLKVYFLNLPKKRQAHDLADKSQLCKAATFFPSRSV